MNPVIHFEMPVGDRDRAADFYAKAFGWHAQKFGPEMGNYVMVSTADSGPDGRPKNPGAINGGLFDKTPDNNVPSVVIGVDDIKAKMKEVTAAGGKLIGEPMDIPGVGQFIAFLDTEGNRVSMLQPS